MKNVALLACLTFVGCVTVGQPTPQERDQLEKWSKLVTPVDRAAVESEAAEHTDWMSRKKTQWMIDQYRACYERAQARAAATRASTRPTSRPW
ncbi:MAG: hypothetical protein ACREJC_10440 [Tepidisphaeraceae bacterium]